MNDYVTIILRFLLLSISTTILSITIRGLVFGHILTYILSELKFNANQSFFGNYGL